MEYFDELGRERPNPQPLEIPLHLRREVSIDERMKQIIRTQMSIEAARSGTETFDEANDFETDDDDLDDLLTPYEVQAMKPESIDPDKPLPPEKLGEGAAPAPADPAPTQAGPEKTG